MLSVVRIEAHTRGKVHSHPEAQWGLLLEGECVPIQGDEEAAMRAGDFWHTPSGVSHGMRTGALGAALGDAVVASKQADAASIRAGLVDDCLRSRGYTVRL